MSKAKYTDKLEHPRTKTEHPVDPNYKTCIQNDKKRHLVNLEAKYVAYSWEMCKMR